MDLISIGRTQQKYQSRGNLLGRSTFILAGLPPIEPCKRANPGPANFNASKRITLICRVAICRFYEFLAYVSKIA
jgi:hypothetical protein